MEDVVAQLPGAGPFAFITVAVSVVAGIVAIAGRRAAADLDRLRSILDQQAKDATRDREEQAADKAALRAELDAARDREEHAAEAARAREQRLLEEKDRVVAELDRTRWELSAARSAQHGLEEDVKTLRVEKAALAETAALSAAKALRVEQAMRDLEDAQGVLHRRAVDGDPS